MRLKFFLYISVFKLDIFILCRLNPFIRLSMKFFSMLMACMVMLRIHPELSSQGKATIKVATIDPSDFNLSKHSVDTSAGAVIIADVGSSYFEGNNRGSFNLVFKHQRRITILSKNGFDAATVNISVYVDGDG